MLGVIIIEFEDGFIVYDCANNEFIDLDIGNYDSDFSVQINRDEVIKICQAMNIKPSELLANTNGCD